MRGRSGSTLIHLVTVFLATTPSPSPVVHLFLYFPCAFYRSPFTPLLLPRSPQLGHRDFCLDYSESFHILFLLPLKPHLPSLSD